MQNNKAKLLLVFFLLIITLPIVSAFEGVIPINMTSNTAPTPFKVWYSPTTLNPSYCYRAFDNNDATPVLSGSPSNQCQISGVGTTATLSVDLGQEYNIVNYTVYSQYGSGSGVGANKWWFQGSTDNSTWTTIDFKAGGTYWGGTGGAKYTATNVSGSYRYFRLRNMTDTVQPSWDKIVQTFSIGVQPLPVAQNYTLTLSAKNIINGTTIRGLCVELDSGTPLTFCNNTGTQIKYIINSSDNSTYNISFYNISGNNHFNQSVINYNFSGTASVTANTSQSRFFVRGTQLFTGNVLTGFNLTNGLTSNITTSKGGYVFGNVGSNTVNLNHSGNYSKNGTCTGVSLSTSNCTISGVYDNQYTFLATDLFNGGAVSNFTINASNNTLGSTSGSTTTRNVTLNLLQGYEYLVQFQGDNHEWINKTLPTNASTHSYTFNVYTRNSVNISFYDELTTNLINYVQASVEYIGSVESGNKSTTTGHVYLDLLTPDTYTLRYSATGYTERFYVLTILNNTFQRLNLTLLNSSSGGTNVTITVKDTLDNLVEGAVVKILKYDLTNNDYDIVDIVTTNFEGESVADIILNSEYYKFIVEYNGVVVLTTNPSYIYGTSLTLIVDLVQGAGFQVATDYSHLSGTITYLNASNQFKYVYNDATNTASQGCLYLYTLGSAKTLYNTSCSSSSSGTIYMSANNATSNYWQAEGYITDSGGVQHLIDSYVLSFKTNLPETGEGMFMLILLVILSALIGVWRIDVSVLLASLQPLLFTIMGFVQLGYVYTVPIFVLGIFMAYLLRLNS